KGSGSSFPNFTGLITVGKKRFTFTLVGTDPSLPRAKNTTVPVTIFPVRFEFADGTVLDPTEPLPDCGGGSTALPRTLASPVFQDGDYGSGPRQFNEQVRRQEFDAFLGLNPQYSVRLAPHVGPRIIVTLSSDFPTQDAPCGKLGLVDLDTWDHFLLTKV